MGLFKSKEEKEQRKQEKELKKEASVAFMGESLQTIGKIPSGKVCILTLKPNDKVLNIHHDKIDITLPYERIKAFKIEDETTLAKSGSTIGRALVGGALFGKTGAVVGGMSATGKTKRKWIATLKYEDKEGNLQELNFIQWSLTGAYEGETNILPFESKINEVISRYSDDITEL